jgi:hypothetical protein
MFPPSARFLLEGTLPVRDRYDARKVMEHQVTASTALPDMQESAAKAAGCSAGVWLTSCP